jgi:hypothetical protein
MKYTKIFILLLVINSIISCKRDSDDVLVKPIIIPPIIKCFYSEVEQGNLITKFILNKDQTIKEIQKINSRTNEIITYTKLNNYIEIKSNLNGYIYKHYINKNGYADSVWITYIGLIDLKAYHKFNSEGLIIKKTLIGTIVNVPFEEITNFTYAKGNLIKRITENEGDIYEESFEYYNDSVNYFIANEEAENFMPASKNLIKKIILPEDKFISYSYTKDTSGIVYQTSINEAEETKLYTYTFNCK